jgi:predicted RNase H-like HicB family nuclease
MSEYLAIIEKEGETWGAYCPDLPGLGVAGSTRAEVEELIREATAAHVESLRQAGEPVPTPTAIGTMLVAAPVG